MTNAPLHIGDLPLATRLWLAPLAGYCDLAFRLVVRSLGGVGLATTALLCPKGVLRQTRKTRELAATDPADRPLAMQFYGSDIDELCQAARWGEDHGADVVDLNMGCPVPKITKRAGGSKLLCDPFHAVRLAERVRNSLARVPLTVKLRLGWDDTDIVAPPLARRLEQVGVAAVIVHGRTAEMQFTGRNRLDGIAAVVAAVDRIPVIGNGDVRSPADAERMMKQTGCAGVMIGRAALSSPWIFRDTWSYLTTGTIPPPPTLEQKCQLMRDHFYGIVRYRGELSAALEFRKCVSWYGKQMNPCRILKDHMRAIKSVAEFEAAITRFLDWRTNWQEQVRLGWAQPEPAEEPAVDEPI